MFKPSNIHTAPVRGPQQQPRPKGHNQQLASQLASQVQQFFDVLMSMLKHWAKSGHIGFVWLSEHGKRLYHFGDVQHQLGLDPTSLSAPQQQKANNKKPKPSLDMPVSPAPSNMVTSNNNAMICEMPSKLAKQVRKCKKPQEPKAKTSKSSLTLDQASTGKPAKASRGFWNECSRAWSE